MTPAQPLLPADSLHADPLPGDARPTGDPPAAAEPRAAAAAGPSPATPPSRAPAPSGRYLVPPSTALEKAIRRARASEANFRALVYHSTDGLVILDEQHTVRLANPTAEALIGRPSELVGTRLDLPDADGTGQEAMLPRKGGRRSIPVRIRRVRLEGEGPPLWLVTLSDLRGRKRGERIATAREIQRTFLPRRRTLTTPLLEVGGLNEHCQDASGDYYDFLDLGKGSLGIALGDAAGHGLAAALLMAQGRAFVRALWPSRGRLLAVMDALNAALHADAPQGRFMSLFLARVDSPSGALSWCNAGHTPGLLMRRATGAVVRLAATGPPVGVLAESRFAVGRRARLARGDTLFLYSDGLTEAQRGRDRFGEERLVELLTSHRDAPVDRLLAAVRNAITRWTGGRALQDDLTMVAARWTGPAGSASDR